jgi:hypothetical protein
MSSRCMSLLPLTTLHSDSEQFATCGVTNIPHLTNVQKFQAKARILDRPAQAASRPSARADRKVRL